MKSRELSPRVRDLIREAARVALNPSQQWLEEFDRATLAAAPPIAENPDLATVISRANRANLRHFAASNLRNPGDPVPANLGAEPLRMARDLVRLGLDALALDVYRVGQNVAWQRWTDIVFGLTTDPQELRELLDVPFRSAAAFIDTTLAGIAAQMELEHHELSRNICAERRRIVELLLNGAPISRDSAESRLGYPLDRSHTAAIIWSDRSDGDHRDLDRAVDAFCIAVGCASSLAIMSAATTRWVWVRDVDVFDCSQIRQVMRELPHVRIAIGTTEPGVDGFRRSHRDALTAARMLIRLRSPQQVAFFGDVEMIALLTENPDGADEFIKNTLGDFEEASPALQHTLLTFISQQCNASRAARLLYTHRNTLMHRLETAQRLLPKPLEDTTVRVAVALEVLQWRSKQPGNPAASGAGKPDDRTPPEQRP
ncbi:PucR family transcriptional regulator [Mycobacterium marinum]|uniref:Rv1453 family transcriptional regulator n=1 Tax=Mycobacterium marinum TaxID=1781 RepID=UPI00234159B3|nr:PucR family transcriptional regulator [Mycobacterium marinum]MDC8992733.1 PucR family transcriptional regulator [Mycobacterium marinum]MDC8998105.1 PucR family transcriptional regulator [Mycobacterium marinum]MDC9008845.1 PucR family transcriptional regulator [Mycobacterium marinum]MDC9014438.1 PucR family transcriptional regulator [Mycobacterium marinum]WDZ16018.1 PucR family transcriptional regulator [Mycobacterium marinum]